MSDGTTSDDLTVTLSEAADPTPESPPSEAVVGSHYMLVFERGSSWVFELPRDGEIIIGRGELAELRLRDPATSRKHAVIRVHGERIAIADLGSHNGTFVNGAKTAAECELRNGDSIAVCAATLVLYASAPAVPPRWIDFPELRERLVDEIERAVRYQRPVAVVSALLVNPADHDAVNRALVAPRNIDVGAWADPSHLVILAPETNRDEADVMARRLRELTQRIDLRIGYAVCPLDGTDPDTLIMNAKAAAASSTSTTVTGATTALRTYRIGDRNAIVADAAMARLYALVERLARVDLPVLISGETGCGKELAARMLHERSVRRERPLVALNCAAIQENLVESELFGHERGAFSGAAATKPGLLETANGGTVFLDEIGELPLTIQAKLLRVLETKRFMRIGDVTEREVNIRLVAATNRNLPDEVDAGRFRQDLFFRLSGAMLTVPPLRERKRELPFLAELFLAEACGAANRPAITITTAAHRALEEHRWPGNVRELKNAMDYFAATIHGTVLEARHVAERLGPPPKPVSPTTSSDPSEPVTFAPINDEIRALEIKRMQQALEAAGGNQTRAAELIGMPLRTFFTKMRQYNLRK